MILNSPYISGSLTVTGNEVVTGSLTVLGGITGAITGSATSASYAFNASYLNNSGSGEFVPTGSFNTFSSSILSYTASNNTNIGNIHSTTASLNTFSGSTNSRLSSIESTTASLNAASGSAITRLNALEVTSGSNITRISALEAASGSAITRLNALEVTSGSNISRLSSLESKTGSYATTGSNTFVAAQYISQSSNPTGFTTTASLYTDGGLRVSRDAYISGTLYLNNVTVYGTQSVCFITSSQLNISSNIISVNTATPSVRFGGLSVFDSGSTGLTGSILWDSQDNQWIYSNPSGSEYDSAMFLVGPRNTGALGGEAGITCNFLSKGNGMHHMTSSAIFDDGTRTCFYGSSIITSTGVGCFSGAVCASAFVGGTISGTTISGTTGTFSSNVVATGSLTVAPSSNVELQVQSTGVTIGNLVSDNHNVTGSLRISGSVGIGITPGSPLHVAGTMKFSNNQAGGPFQTLDIVPATTIGSSANRIVTLNTTDLAFEVGLSERMRITCTGITCFSGQVCVNDKVVILDPTDGSATALFVGTRDGSMTVGQQVRLDFSQNTSPLARIAGEYTGGTFSSALTFSTNATCAETLTEQLRINCNGIACFRNTVCSPAFVGGTVTAGGDIVTPTRVASDTYNGYTGGSTPLTIQTGGAQNVVIGTNNTTRLTIGSTGLATLTCRLTVGGSMLLGEVQSSYSLVETTTGNGIWLRPAGIASPSGLFVTIGGCVGIGSTSPISTLTVSCSVSSRCFTGIIVENFAGAGSECARAGIAFKGYDWVQGGIWHGRNGGAFDGALVFGTNPDTSNLTVGGLCTRLVFTNAGIAIFSCQICTPTLSVNSGVTLYGSAGGLGCAYITTATGVNEQDAIILDKAGGFGTSIIRNYYTNIPNYGLAFRVGALTGVYIQCQGHVGIGTSTPTFLLDLQRSSAGADVAIRVQNTAASGINDAAALHLGWSSTLAGYSSIITDRGGRAGTTLAQGSLYFNANQDTVERIRMTIRGDSGCVGIGTTAPSAQLQIVAPYVQGTNAISAMWSGVGGFTATLTCASGVQPYATYTFSNGNIVISTDNPVIRFQTLTTTTADTMQIVGASFKSSGPFNCNRIGAFNSTHLSLETGGSSRLLIDNAGIACFSNVVYSPRFLTCSGVAVNTTINTPTTLISIPTGTFNNGIYLFSAYLSGTGAPSTDYSTALITSDANAYNLTNIKAGSNMVISLSGADIRGTQCIFTGANISWTFTRLL